MKRCGLIIILSLLMCGSAYAKITIGISIPTADHGWTGGIVWWAEQAIKELEAQYPQVEFVLVKADNYVAQNADIEEMLNQGITGLVILPHNPPHLANILRKVQGSEVFIVIVDRNAPSLVSDIYIAGDNYHLGRLCAEYLVKDIRGKGDIVVMEGIPCEVNTLRVQGFMDVIANYPDIRVLDSQPAYWSEEKGFELMDYYLSTFPKIDAVWSGDDDVLEGALSAYRESGRNDVRRMLGGGGSKNIVKMILDNDPLVHATVTYPPQMIHEGIYMAIGHLINQKEYDKRVITPSMLVTKENASEYYFPDSIY